MLKLIIVLFDCLGSSTQTSEHDINEQIGEVKPRDVPIPAQSSVIIDGE